MNTVSCLRGGDDDDLPPIRVISKSAYLERVAAESEAQAESQSPAELAARYAIWNRGLSLFKLAPADYTLNAARSDSADMVAAAYFPRKKDIVVIDHGEPMDDRAAFSLLAHEIVHAMQDRDYDLERFDEQHAGSIDESLASDAIVEGEAVHYQLMVSALLRGLPLDKLDWKAHYAQWRADTFVDAEADPAPVARAQQRFPYPFGGGYVTQYWLARGRAGIDQLFEQPPRTTSEIMFGTSFSELESAREQLHEHAIPILPEGYTVETGTSLGAWIARIYAARQVADVAGRLAVASHLSADSFVVQRDAADDKVVASWRVRTSDEDAARAWPVLTPLTAASSEVQERDVLQVAAERIPAFLAADLAWRAPVESHDDDEQSGEASVGWSASLRPRHRACVPLHAAAP